MITKLLSEYSQPIIFSLAGEIKKTRPRLNVEVRGDGAKQAFELAVKELSSWGVNHLFLIRNDHDDSVVHIVSVEEIESTITMKIAESVVSIVDPGSTKGLTIDTDDENSICITCWGGSEPLIELLKQHIPEAVVFLAN